jgi:hypothetical protein
MILFLGFLRWGFLFGFSSLVGVVGGCADGGVSAGGPGNPSGVNIVGVAPGVGVVAWEPSPSQPSSFWGRVPLVLTAKPPIPTSIQSRY